MGAIIRKKGGGGKDRDGDWVWVWVQHLWVFTVHCSLKNYGKYNKHFVERLSGTRESPYQVFWPYPTLPSKISMLLPPSPSPALWRCITLLASLKYIIIWLLL